MQRLFRFSIFFALLVAVITPSGAFARGLAADNSSQTYTVLVGYENTSIGYDVMGFFPNVATIHVGDTVHWKINSVELHTVTFLAGGQAPELLLPSAFVPGADPNVSPLLFNPAAANPVIPAGGMYDGSTFANSGLMGYESWEAQGFDLTFTKPGTYTYLCLVHGVMMSGQVVVKGSDEAVPSPQQESAMGAMQISAQKAKVPAAFQAAYDNLKPDVLNPDGSKTHTVFLGYEDGQIDLMQFFPKQVNVRPGDTVVWEMSASNHAPHTVTFLNGAQEPELVVVVPQPSEPPFLYINPEILDPSQPGAALSRSGEFNSGLAMPIPGEFYSLKIGPMSSGQEPYLCLLHDESGMVGSLVVTP